MDADGELRVLDTPPMSSSRMLYDEVGGMPFFEGLVDRFYMNVADDPVLLRLYPDRDLGPARRRLTRAASFPASSGLSSRSRMRPR